MEELEVLVMQFGTISGVAALFTHVRLVSSLLVGKSTLNSVELALMGLERAALCEGLVAVSTLERLHPWSNDHQSVASFQ